MDYIEHHGIKGQKWGVRRYQSSDGSLTSEGRRRYGGFGTKLRNANESLSSKLESAKRNSIERRRTKTLKTHNPSVLLKNMSLLSEEEYNKTYTRLSRETSLKELKQRSKSRGRKYVEKELEKQASRLISNQLDSAIVELGKALVKA